MMEIDFNLGFGDLLQIGLILVLISQTIYLARQTNFFRRTNQASLKEKWIKDFDTINFDLLDPASPNLPDLNEFEKLIRILYKMHPLFQEKLLKPSDFSIMFIVLYYVTQDERLRKTDFYKEEYLKLQEIFSDLNSDIGVITFLFSIPPTSTYKKIIEETSLKKLINSEKMISGWTDFSKGLRWGVWFSTKIRRKPFFRLEPPIE